MYRQSGGCICWHRSGPERAAAIAETGRFVSDSVREGAPIRVRDMPYLFLDMGAFVPGLNIIASDLVDHLLTQAAAPRIDLGAVTAVVPVAGRYRVVGTGGDLTAGSSSWPVAPATSRSCRRSAHRWRSTA
ncbi:hypothetical protein [Phytohabitans kaempferiae]|uniref:Carboxyltransferase domain-containing protein n=1 Tax=Phytohabitans kaempferiae TaxID=1620943 RepID=A0ABV6M260_9ACTN